jgi:hypothetical protein
MTRTILISVTAFMLMAGAWTANLVFYHPSPVDSANPLAPISTSVDWR